MNIHNAAMLLPQPFRSAVIREYAESVPEEIRLRVGLGATVLHQGRERELQNCRSVTVRDIETVLELATGASLHTAGESIRQGFITAAGGLRIGLCGSVISTGGRIEGMKRISSIALRLPSEQRGCADKIFPLLTKDGLESTLIISPPGAGKTTLLRELVRRLSLSGVRLALADERGEIAAVYQGVAQLDVGPRTDVMSGAGKAEAIMMLLRSMSPEVIALDEITAAQDIAAIENAANCGVRLLATAHAADFADLHKRPLYRRLLEEGIFTRAVLISVRDGRRQYRVESIGGEMMEC